MIANVHSSAFLAVVIASWMASAMMLPQNPVTTSEREQVISIACGPHGSTSEHFLPNGDRVIRNERKYGSLDEARQVLEAHLLEADSILSRQAIHDELDRSVGKRAMVLIRGKALEILYRDVWVTTTEAPSLASLNAFQERDDKRD